MMMVMFDVNTDGTPYTTENYSKKQQISFYIHNAWINNSTIYCSCYIHIAYDIKVV